jgi:tetratricopeptide (TPR) repeat protein
MDRVLELSNSLRERGLDCIIDQYEESPPEGWPLWCEKQVEDSQYVLVLCTETYLRRFKGEESPGNGLGVTWEGHVITQELYDAQGKNAKFVPVMLPGQDAAHIPVTLRGATRYTLPADEELLYRRLTGQPLVTKPPLGKVQPLPPRKVLPPLPVLERKQAFRRPWNVPHTRNPFFTGRTQALDDVHKALATRGAAALSGLQGTGKTQVAVEYAHRHRDEHLAVLWAKAESRETLVGDLALMAALLGLPEGTGKEQDAAVEAVKRWLDANSNWLLILDNGDDLGMARQFIPRDSKGQILLTTCAQATGPVAERIEIEEMPPEEGALFLLRRAGVIFKDAAIADVTDADRETAEQVSRELGGLPLALDQAGAYIEETPSSLREYQELYKAEGNKLLIERGRFGDHASVAVTFALAFEKVSGNSSAAADLIRICAFLAPDAIPEEIFSEGAAELGENLRKTASSPFEFAQVLKEAGRFSLLRRNPADKTLGIHRLVQAVVRERMTEAEQGEWAERTVRAVSRALPDVEYPNWPRVERFLPHALVCAILIEEFAFQFEPAAHLLYQAGSYLDDRARYAEAERLYMGNLAIVEKALGPEHPIMAPSLNNLALLYNRLGRYAEAEPLYERALAIGEKTLGPEHPNVAVYLNNLASLYNNLGKYAQAQPLLERSLAIDEKALGPEHPGVAPDLNNLASLYSRQGKYIEAQPLLERALAIDERALGPEHPNVATCLNNLATVYNHLGKYAQAQPLLERALAIDERALGPEHPDVGPDLSNLAWLYSRQGKYVEAEQLLKRALAICEKALGPAHPNVATVLEGYADLFEKTGRGDEAQKMRARALAIRAEHDKNNPAR